MEPITEDELADFIAWLDKSVHYLCDIRGVKRSTRTRRLQLLEELRQRALCKTPQQMELFP